MDQVIDINADVGERPDALADGTEAAIIGLISSANIACGGHAGDDETMRQVIRLCMQYGVSIGAHPSYPDRARFGRERLLLSTNEIQATVFEQVRALGRNAQSFGAELRHVKPHGALYNTAAVDLAAAEAIAEGVGKWSRDLTLVGLAGSLMLTVWQEKGFRIAGEAFADRMYESDGTLRSRKKENAVITDPEVACRQAIGIIRDGTVISVEGVARPMRADTLSVNSDTPHAVEILAALRRTFLSMGIAVKSFI